MSNNNRDTLQAWIAEQLQAVEEQGSLSALGCRHQTGTGDDREVFSMKVGHPKWGDVDGMTEVFWTNATRTAKGLVGFQQFSMEAMFGSQTKPTRFLPFGIIGMLQLPGGGGGASFGGMSTEGPTPMGQTQQGMRLTELIVQGSIQDRQHITRVLLEFIDKLVVENGQYKRETGELWLALREQFAKQVADARAHHMELLKFMRSTEMQRKLFGLAPALLNMMANRDMFPVSTADTGILMTLVECVPEADVNRVLVALSTKPEAAQFATVLKNRLDEIRAQKSAEREEINRQIEAATGKTYEEAERDAGGEAAKVLTRIGRPPEDTVAPKVLEAALDVKEAPPVEAAGTTVTVESGDDTKLVDDLFAKVPAGQVDMLLGILAADDPDLGRRVKERLAKKAPTV